jgi:Ca2+-binding EF-hand superfamily protein
MSINHFVQRKRVLGFYFFDLSKDGLVRAEDLQKFGETIATKMNLESGSDNYKKIMDGYNRYWQAFAPASDSNGDGSVTCAEFVESLSKVLSLPNGKQIFEQLNHNVFDAMDLNGSGAIGKDEYSIFVSAGGISTEAAHQAFNKLDVDGSGVITRAEYSECIWEYWTSEDPNARGNWFFGNN